MKKQIITLIILAVLAAGGYYYYAQMNTSDKKQQQTVQAMPVQVVEVKEKDFYPSLSFVSKIEAILKSPSNV